jgi:hypothetical protein
VSAYLGQVGEQVRRTADAFQASLSAFIALAPTVRTEQETSAVRACADGRAYTQDPVGAVRRYPIVAVAITMVPVLLLAVLFMILTASAGDGRATPAVRHPTTAPESTRVVDDKPAAEASASSPAPVPAPAPAPASVPAPAPERASTPTAEDEPASKAGAARRTRTTRKE